jgi:hypothetical protein
MLMRSWFDDVGKGAESRRYLGAAAMEVRLLRTMAMAFEVSMVCLVAVAAGLCGLVGVR